MRVFVIQLTRPLVIANRIKSALPNRLLILSTGYSYSLKGDRTSFALFTVSEFDDL
jgi:hypothetical protein